MPTTSPKQHKFMQAVAHGMKPRDSDITKEEAQEFVDADKRKDAKKAEDPSVSPDMQHLLRR